jgi:hypothetical protein
MPRTCRVDRRSSTLLVPRSCTLEPRSCTYMPRCWTL